MLFGGEKNIEGNTPWLILSTILFILIIFGCAYLISDFERLQEAGCENNRHALYDFPLVLLIIMSVVMTIVIAMFVLKLLQFVFLQ